MGSGITTDSINAPFGQAGLMIGNNWRTDSGSQITIAPYNRMWLFINGNWFTIYNLVKSGLSGLNIDDDYYIYVEAPDVSSLQWNKTYKAYEITNAANIIVSDSVPDRDNAYDIYFGNPDSSITLVNQRCIGQLITDNDSGALTVSKCYNGMTHMQTGSLVGTNLSAALTNSYTNLTFPILPPQIFFGVKMYAQIEITGSVGNSNVAVQTRDALGAPIVFDRFTHVATTPNVYLQVNRNDVPLYMNASGEFGFAINVAPTGSMTLNGWFVGYENPW